jgi:hypothetical protein
VTSDQRVIALQGENEKLKQKLASNQLDLANKPSEDHTGGDLLAELQATCVKSDFVKMRFMFILNTPSKSSAANRLPPDPKSIFQEIKKTCQITNQEPNCEAAIEKLGRSFVKNWTPKTTAGDIFMPSSCVKKPFIQDAGQTYRLQLSQVHESSAAKTAGTKDGAVVVQDGRPPSE